VLALRGKEEMVVRVQAKVVVVVVEQVLLELPELHPARAQAEQDFNQV
jgi:hypothetical protein